MPDNEEFPEDEILRKKLLAKKLKKEHYVPPQIISLVQTELKLYQRGICPGLDSLPSLTTQEVNVNNNPIIHNDSSEEYFLSTRHKIYNNSVQSKFLREYRKKLRRQSRQQKRVYFEEELGLSKAEVEELFRKRPKTPSDLDKKAHQIYPFMYMYDKHLAYMFYLINEMAWNYSDTAFRINSSPIQVENFYRLFNDYSI